MLEDTSEDVQLESEDGDLKSRRTQLNRLHSPKRLSPKRERFQDAEESQEVEELEESQEELSSEFLEDQLERL